MFANRCLLLTLALALLARPCAARPAFVRIIDELNSPTDAEQEVRTRVQTEKCNACHPAGGKRRPMPPLGQRFYIGLKQASGGTFRHDREFWSKDAEGNYRPEAIALIRAAIRLMPPKGPLE